MERGPQERDVQRLPRGALLLHEGGPGKRLRDDGQLKAELDYCVPRGIPHSIFLGRLPAPGEPHWLPADRAKALAWQADQADHCSHCRQRISDWEDEHGKALKDPPFEVIELQCPACELLAYHEEEVKEAQEGVDSAPRYGIRYGFKRVTED